MPATDPRTVAAAVIRAFTEEVTPSMRDELIASLVRRADPIEITTALGQAAAQFAELAGIGRGSDLTASEMMDWREAGGSGLTHGSCA